MKAYSMSGRMRKRCTLYFRKSAHKFVCCPACGLLFLKKEQVTPSPRNDIYQAPCHQISTPQQVVTVTLVTETYAYAINDELGTVFIPGSAFQQTEVAKLDSHLAVGDCLVVYVRSQAPRCGCSWIAEHASKITLLNCVASSVLNTDAVDRCFSPADDDHIQKGAGIIVWVDGLMACAMNLCSQQVMCPILTWTGGDDGKLFAQSLSDVVEVGQTVYYEASMSDIGLRARWWSNRPRTKLLADSYTQTTLTVEQMILRSLEPDILQHLQTKIPHIIQLAKHL